MTNKGTGLFGFVDFTTPIVRRGYDKKKTDRVIREFRDNETVYQDRIKELENNLEQALTERKLAIAQRNGWSDAMVEVCVDSEISKKDIDRKSVV